MFYSAFIHVTYVSILDKMASEATLSIESSKSYRNGTQRSNDALEKFEKSFSRINTPIWMREKVPKIRLPATTTDEDLNYNENTFINENLKKLEPIDYLFCFLLKCGNVLATMACVQFWFFFLHLLSWMTVGRGQTKML